jgi:glycine dehydrogenase
MVPLRVVSRFARLSNRLAFSSTTRRGLATIKPQSSLLSPLDTFSERHIGPDDHETSSMLAKLGYASMDAFIENTVPPGIRVSPESIDNISIPVLSESQLHARAQALGGQNKRFKSYIGMGYHSAVVPPVILRNVCSWFLSDMLLYLSIFQVMENPAWYTPYTPYQPEVAQGKTIISICCVPV